MYEYRKLSPDEKKQAVIERLARGFPAHAPPHLPIDKATYLLTAACYEHQCHMLATERRRALLDRFFEEAIMADIGLLAWVVLPNHYHVLATVEVFERLSGVFGRTHGATSHAWNEADGSKGRRVWYRYADRLIRSESHYFTTLNYIHYNPVKHGWADSPYAWAESSVHWYLANCGREWLRDLWMRYPLKGYGQTWDR
jgi:putative transposase